MQPQNVSANGIDTIANSSMTYEIAATRRYEIVLETVCDGALSTPVVVTAMTAK